MVYLLMALIALSCGIGIIMIHSLKNNGGKWSGLDLLITIFTAGAFYVYAIGAFLKGMQ